MRGQSMSAGRPVASARVGYDHPSGIYADGSATVVLTRGEDLRFLGYQADAGVALRAGERWTIDVGVAHNQLRAADAGEPPHGYTEGYVGALHPPFSAYVFVSPNYFRYGAWTLYGQVEAALAPAEDWRLTAHVGALSRLDYASRRRTLYDWRLGVARELGNVELHAALSGGGPARQSYGGALHARTALTAGASLAF